MPSRLIVSCLLIVLAACSSSKNEQRPKEKDTVEMVMTEGKPVPPNHCRVLATVVSIDAALKGRTENDPCSKAPCVARVRIDSVLGYGSAFGKPLATGSEISLHFTTTLSPTKELLPEITPALPGLTVGAKFTADIRTSTTLGSTDAEYSVSSYKKR